MATLQSQLITLRAHYTDDYPDVAKTKRDIAELQKKLDEINAAIEASMSGAPGRVLIQP